MSSPEVNAAVTGWGIHIPGVPMKRWDETLAGDEGGPPGPAAERLGAKGLLGKEQATLLALCAVHRAIDSPAGKGRSTGPPDPRTAVVASSNLGNVGTVCKVVRDLRDGGLRDISPLDAPNASSNIIASTVAIWFGWGGPNLMVCSGATSGLDAVRLACVLLRSGRCERAVVVGAEPDDEDARSLHAPAAKATGAPLRAGAGAVILERPTAREGTFYSGIRIVVPARPCTAERPPASVVLGRRGPAGAHRVIDLVREIGDLYGALGVVQTAAAAAMIASSNGPEAVQVSCGDTTDGWRTALLLSSRI